MNRGSERLMKTTEIPSIEWRYDYDTIYAQSSLEELTPQELARESKEHSIITVLQRDLT